jgi:hypothetical protein
MIVLINASHPLFSREGFSSHLTKARISVYQRFMQIRVFMLSREGQPDTYHFTKWRLSRVIYMMGRAIVILQSDPSLKMYMGLRAGN